MGITRAGLDGRFEPGPLQSQEMSAARRAVNLFSTGLLAGQMIGMTPVLLANCPQMGLGAVGVSYGYGAFAMATSILSSSRLDIRTAFTVLYDGAAGTVLLPVYYIGDIRFTGVPIVLGG